MVMASPRTIDVDGHTYRQTGRLDDWTLRYEWAPPSVDEIEHGHRNAGQRN